MIIIIIGLLIIINNYIDNIKKKIKIFPEDPEVVQQVKEITKERTGRKQL